MYRCINHKSLYIYNYIEIDIYIYYIYILYIYTPSFQMRNQNHTAGMCKLPDGRQPPSPGFPEESCYSRLTEPMGFHTLHMVSCPYLLTMQKWLLYTDLYLGIGTYYMLWLLYFPSNLLTGRIQWSSAIDNDNLTSIKLLSYSAMVSLLIAPMIFQANLNCRSMQIYSLVTIINPLPPHYQILMLQWYILNTIRIVMVELIVMMMMIMMMIMMIK